MAIDDLAKTKPSLFFRDLSGSIIEDECYLAPRFLPEGYYSLPIRPSSRAKRWKRSCNTTLANVSDFAAGLPLKNEVKEP